jgi:hypothetical protein
MKTHFILNGETQLVLKPTSDAEHLLLKQLLEGEVEVTKIQGNLNILETNVSDGIIIRKKKKAVENASDEIDSLELLGARVFNDR